MSTSAEREKQEELQRQTYLKRHGDSMIILLRKINNAVKYIVCFIVFIICVTRTYPGDPGVLPAYYLITALFLAATVKILKKILKQPRPEPEQCAYHHPKKFSQQQQQGPTNIVVGGGGKDENEDVMNNKKNNTDQKFLVAEDDGEQEEDEEEGLNDDHGMPSSHSALLGYFSWIAIFGFFSHDAFGLMSRAMGGLVGVLLPLFQMIFDGSAILGFITQKQESAFENLAGGGAHQRTSESLSFLLIVIMICLTLFVLGVFGSSLRVINGDHTWPQALVGYSLGFLWACGSVVMENKIFDVNAQSVQVQGIWMASAIVLGLIGGYFILIVKKKKRFYERKRTAQKQQ